MSTARGKLYVVFVGFFKAALEQGKEHMQTVQIGLIGLGTVGSGVVQILQEHGNYDWLTGSGSLVISNNGIEWAATYLVMLLALFFTGAGRYFSLDYWIARRWRNADSC